MLTGILSIFFMGLGLSLVIGKAPGGKWFLKTTKNAAMAPVKAVGKTAKAQASGILKKYKSEIFAFVTGIGFMGMLANSFLWEWILAISLILIAGWLIGLAIASNQGRRDEYRDMSWDAIVRAGTWLWANHKSKIIWVGIGMMVYIIFPRPHV